MSDKTLEKTKELLDERTVAKILGVSVRTLQSWRRCGKGPSFIKLAKKLIRYRVEDVLDYLDSHLVPALR